MITIGNHRVQKVAELVRRLDPDEIRQLIRLVPQLHEKPQVVTEKDDEADELVLWVREQMAQYATESRPMRDDDPFLGGITVGAYFALPGAERERIWGELYAQAIESAAEREVQSDAIVTLAR